MDILLLLLLDIAYCIQINTKLGDIQGITKNGIHKFLNIPYAEPPIGDLRWRPTKSLQNTWNGVYNATKFGNVCVQPTYSHPLIYDLGRKEEEQSKVSEDCLYLNVYTPYNFDTKSSKSSLLPVFFWIHGGGLEMDTSMASYYDASIFANDQNIVIVTINYRLGRAAWMIDPLLMKSSTGNGGANGFLDMIEALKWTKSNIESFGGNPNEITIGGESGGGWAVCGLVISPLTKGLFKRSIQMSGSCIKSTGRFLSTQEGYKQTKKIRDVLGAKSFEELRTMNMQDICDAGYGNMDITNLPSTDGYVFPMDTIELIQNGHINGESVMIGTLFLESFSVEPYNMGPLMKTEEELNQYYFENFFDSQVSEIQKYYPFNDINSKIWKYKSIFNTTSEIIQTTQHTDCWVRCGSIAQTDIITTNAMTKNRISVYFYQYGHISEPWDQVNHGYDEQCLFGQKQYYPIKFHQSSEKFNKITMKFFGEYIKGIGPINNENNKPATIQNGYYLYIVDDIKVVDVKELNVVKQRCKLWDLWGNHAYNNYPICYGINTVTDDDVTVELEQFFDNMTLNK